LVEKINSLEKRYSSLKDEDFKGLTLNFKKRIKKGESLEDLLPEAFAAVREAAKRTLNQRHFDVQLLGGIVLHQGKIAEMATGEGKTLAATLAVYLNALTGRGVHIVTVNDYLAQRDTVWMGQIYDFLGLKTSCLIHEEAYLYDSQWQKKELDKKRDTLGAFKVIKDFLRPISRKEAYLADITYGNSNEFGFDYLRDNMVYSLKDKVQRGHYYAIVDEVDSILIDEARTPLIISQPDIQSSDWYKRFALIVEKLKEGEDYEVDEKFRSVSLTSSGIRKVEKMLGVANLYSPDNFHLVHYLDESLKAKALFFKDKDYVVKNNEIVIVDEFTGRLMPGRRFSGGLHQALEAKERVPVKAESRTLGTITYQNYFRLYEKLSGMTGTAQPSAEEFDKVYHLEVISIPTNKPMIRKDLPDLVFLTKKAKFRNLTKRVLEAYQKGRPVLIGTRSIEMNEFVSRLFEQFNIPHQVLNAKHHEEEGAIIAQAGRLKAVTVATNMAGRGVDIILGGNPPDEEEAKKVKELGGLLVLGTERHEARRIDDQLRGRAGRQGDPGSSQFYLSLEDDLLRVFGSERLKKMMEKLNMPEDLPIESKLVAKAVREAQKKIEGINFDIRKRTLEYDEVLQKQREKFYQERDSILLAEKENLLLEKAREIILNSLRKITLSYFSLPQENSLTEMFLNLGLIQEKESFIEKIKEAKEKEDQSLLESYLKEISLKAFEEKFKDIEKKDSEEKSKVFLTIKILSLQILDNLWSQHLEDMESLRESVNIRAWGQRDPLVEYKTESLKIWRDFFDKFELLFFQNFFLFLKKITNAS
ncbi:preprotein translocase subunit SecA, partial [bacterium]|nr:preprotein translocase subunit SecA [bacterium]